MSDRPSSAYRIQVESLDGKWRDVFDTPVCGFARATTIFDDIKADFRKRMLKGMGFGKWKVLTEADVDRLNGRKIGAVKESA